MDRFFQEASPETRMHKGTGLGLSIVKSYVEMHGGEISVTSRQSEGSTFTIVLPSDRVRPVEDNIAEFRQSTAG